MVRKLVDTIVRIGQIELGNYPPTTAPETLYRHHRIARTFGWLWVASGALMASGMVELMLGHEGWLRTVSLVVVIGSMLVCLVSALPGIASGLWIKSIDQALLARGLPIPGQEKELEKAIPRYAMKMVYWFAILVLSASLIHAGILRAQ